MTYAYGGKYVGEFRDGKRTGQGSYTWPEGVVYDGEWQDSLRHGQGTLDLQVVFISQTGGKMGNFWVTVPATVDDKGFYELKSGASKATNVGD